MKQLRLYQRQAVNECWQALKKSDEPVLLMASVGAGKSLMLADILLTFEKHGKRALCLVNNAELVRNNSETFNAQGGHSSIFCAALDSKISSAPVVFGTPQSILNGINKNEDIGRVKFNVIVVDEAHNINYLDQRTCFMRILRHFKHEYPEMRLLGATGTNFRYKGSAIVGEGCLFKSQVGNITTEQLIRDEYLINPSFTIDPDLVIDFSRVKVKSNGQFDQKQLAEVIEQSARLTELICKQIVHVMEIENRFGVFLFATTKKHAHEILSHLPPEESAIILGETPQDERTKILEMARQGDVRYLVNIAIISVGVDVPAYDTIAYLRPTESLVLLVQTMGRALRLSEATGKQDALIMDFAGNIERHSDWDNPILLEALKQTIDRDKPLVILCPKCQKMNTEYARRCIGVVNNKRCDYYFEFKECPNELCKVKNDIASRQCRLCEQELIDPNEKLSLEVIKKPVIDVLVLEAKYRVSGTQDRFRVKCVYKCQDSAGRVGNIYENYSPINERAKNVFYGQFVRKHCSESSRWYMHLSNKHMVEQMLQTIDSPYRLSIVPDSSGTKIKRKYFNE